MNFFKKLFRQNKSKHTFERLIGDIKKRAEDYVNLRESIFPVIKSDDDLRIKASLNNNPILTEKISDGIVLCYVFDIGDAFELISVKHLEDFGLTIPDIKEIAISNLISKVNLNCEVSTIDLSKYHAESKPFYRIDMDGHFNPSMMLLDGFWESTAKHFVDSDTIAVSIPAKNILVFSDMKLLDSFGSMRPFASQMFDASVKENIQLTKNTYIRKNGKWILFLSTEEQMTELW